jgi:hypothetical protein
MKILHFWYLTMMVILSASQVSGQCCSAGNAFTGADHGPGLEKGDLAISILSKYSESAQYYLGDQKSDFGDIREASLLYSELAIQYGIDGRLSLKADIGYFFFKREDYKNDNAPDAIGKGFGDSKISLHYMLIRNNDKHHFLRASLGASLPSGVFDQQLNNIRLPLTLQASSGSWKILGSLVFSKDQSAKTSWAASLHYETSLPINSHFFHYQYGDVFAISGGAQYKWRKNVHASLMARAQVSGRATRDGAVLIESTGGSIFYLVPELRLRVLGQYNFIAGIELPVYKHYNGVQLSHSYALQIKISRVYRTDKAASVNT